METALVCLPHNPGDVLMGLHFAQYLKSLPQISQVDFLVSEESVNLVSRCSFIHRVIEIPRKEIRNQDTSDPLSQGVKILKEWISQYNTHTYTYSFNLFQDHWGAVLHSFFPSHLRFGYDYIDQNYLSVRHRTMEHYFAIPVDRKDNPYHVIDLWKRCIPIPSQTSPILDANWELSSECISLFGGDLTKHSNRIAIQTGSAWPGKRWDPQCWAQLIQMLLADNFEIFFLGAPEEKTWTSKIVSMIEIENSLPKNFKNLVGKTTLEEVPALLKSCSLLVTGDTFAMHAAASVGTQVLALFGPSNPIETGPYGKGHMILQLHLHHPTELEFSRNHPAWNHLKAEHIYTLITKGIPPKEFSVWYTKYSKHDNCQILKSPQGLLHPYQQRLTTWNKIFDQQDFRIGMYFPESLDQAFEQAISNPTKENLIHLEELEMQFGSSQETSLFWESYRIAVNGLPLYPLRSFLLKRRSRLLKCLAELNYFNSPELS